MVSLSKAEGHLTSNSYKFRSLKALNKTKIMENKMSVVGPSAGRELDEHSWEKPSEPWSGNSGRYSENGIKQTVPMGPCRLAFLTPWLTKLSDVLECFFFWKDKNLFFSPSRRAQGFPHSVSHNVSFRWVFLAAGGDFLSEKISGCLESSRFSPDSGASGRRSYKNVHGE